MTIKFSGYDWKDIMRVCGAVIEPEKSPREMLKYIRLHCENGWCEAVGSNSYQVSRVECICGMDDLWPVDVLLPLIKAPAGARRVELTPYDKALGHVVVFFDGENNIINRHIVPVPDGEYIDIDMVMKKALDRIDTFNDGKGQYMIVVNPKLLLNALSGLKECKSVIFNFGSPVDAFTIRPYIEDDLNAMAMVYPIRMA